MKLNFSIIILVILMVANSSLAEIPRLVNYQGRLTNLSGDPVVDGVYSITFTIYDAVSGGNSRWTEAHASVNVAEGLFNVLLGSINPIEDTVFNSPDRYLGIQVEADPEIIPRTRLVSVPYSYHSLHADTADFATSAGTADDGDWTDDGSGNIYRLNGNIGIGTNTPNNKLHIRGNARIGELGFIQDYPEVLFNSYHNGSSAVYATDGSAFSIAHDQVNDRLHFKYAPPGVEGTSVSFDRAMVIKDNGFVGIGTTSPSQKLHVAGAVSATTYYGDGSNLTGISGTSDNDWTINGSTIYHLTGNVGVGTTTPGANLDVNGTVNVNGPGGAVNALTANTNGTYAALTGFNTGSGPGVYAESQSTASNVGAVTGRAKAQGGSGIYGETWESGAPGTASSLAVFGWAAHNGVTTGGGCIGVMGKTDAYRGSGAEVPMGVYGEAMHATGVCWGVAGETHSTHADAVGVKGTLLTAGAQGKAILGVGAAPGWAGYFQGNVNVTGTISKGGGGFKIDHPLDPENNYLYHSFVESPDMMNVYNGNVVTNSDGFAEVILPDYFETLNKDFRYQLTVIGQFAQAIVGEKISDNSFSVQTDKPNVEVSWQVTGIRKDPFAEANRIPVEEEKASYDKGLYLHPEALGKDLSLTIR